jgi:hypothetical protein
MSLKPASLAVKDYPVALKPSLGYEKQLYVSPLTHTVLGSLDIMAANSGVYTPTVADNAMLGDVPQELMMVLDSDADFGASALVVTVVGTDATGGALTGTATFSPPTYAQDQTFTFPKGWAAEVTIAAGKKFKTVTSVTAATAANIPTTPKLLLVGMPSLDFSAGGTFRKIATRVKLNYDPAVPLPTAVQDGRRKGAYIKPGEIDVPSLEITAKVPTDADGLSRYNGKRVTGWIREMKEEKLHTQNIFLLGLVMTVKANVGEGADPTTLDATAMYENYAMIIA